MKKILKYFILISMALLIAMQFYRPERSNPPVDKNQTLEARLNVPPEVQNILRRACNDCHSNETVWPWYTEVAPVSWIIANHVEEGRKHLNFSEFSKYKPERVSNKLEEMAEEVEKGAMPLSGYVLMHKEAALTPEEIETLVRWAQTAQRSFGTSKKK